MDQKKQHEAQETLRSPKSLDEQRAPPLVVSELELEGQIFFLFWGGEGVGPSHPWWCLGTTWGTGFKPRLTVSKVSTLRGVLSLWPPGGQAFNPQPRLKLSHPHLVAFQFSVPRLG